MKKKAEARFKDYLKTRNLKLTKPRIEILHALMDIKKHFNAEELFNLLKVTNANSISRATVYRTLSLLEDASMIESMDFNTGYKTYEFVYDVKHHDHIICLDHEKIIEFTNPEIERLQNEIADKLGFVVEYHSLKIYCRHKNQSTCD